MGLSCKPMGDLGRMLAQVKYEQQKEAAQKRQSKMGKEKSDKSKDKNEDK